MSVGQPNTGRWPWTKKRGWAATIEKMDALTIILSAPDWPNRDHLSPYGYALNDSMTNGAKEFAVCMVRGEFKFALTILSLWTRLLHSFMDSARIEDANMDVEKANKQLLAVYLHYMGQMADFSKVEGSR